MVGTIDQTLSYRPVLLTEDKSPEDMITGKRGTLLTGMMEPEEILMKPKGD